MLKYCREPGMELQGEPGERWDMITVEMYVVGKDGNVDRWLTIYTRYVLTKDFQDNANIFKGKVRHTSSCSRIAMLTITKFIAESNKNQYIIHSTLAKHLKL